ncbi:MAG: hypothetical protein JW808_00815 [Victivallales bacterium]|nr:hypothetical protein [Victivallales bacterium]
MNSGKEKWLESFREASCEFRGAPFWAWNGKLETGELRRQIRLMKKMGLGGFFMHSRVGLDTAYLSDEWFDCVRACIDEARKLGMNAWLYDEDRWPSGAAGGLVTCDKTYRARILVMEELPNGKGFEKKEGTLALFAALLDDSGKATKLRELEGNDTRLLPGETLLHFHVSLQGESSWYNGQTYLDTLDREAVARFIEVTHERYLKEVGEDFGKVVPGIFTDEPNFMQVCQRIDDSRTSAPWSRKLRQEFKRMHGYDILGHLPEIFLDIAGIEFPRARYHYHDCITAMFVDSFARQIGEWCGKNNMMHTGHVLAEPTLGSQVSCVGSCLRFYEHMQAPGMDLLTEYDREYDTAKQVSSAARQLGRKWRLTETYGCTGWDFPFKGHKALGDWQAALGINLRCQHLSWYTMQGQAKRDYPAGIFYQSPWCRHYSKVEDYFARINAVMTNGVEVRDLLVLHANESMWLLFKKGHDEGGREKAFNGMFIKLRDSLLDAGIDFDYGDEEMMSRHGSVVGGKNPVLKLALAEYRAVVVPPLLTLRSTTLKLLKEFRDAGGKVVFAGDIPGHVDAVKNDAVAEFAKNCASAPSFGPGLAAAVECCRRVSITDGCGGEIADALYLLREDADRFYFFMCNTGFGSSQSRGKDIGCPPVRDRKASYDSVRVSGFDGCEGDVIELDPETGEIFLAWSRRAGGRVEIDTSLPELGSKLFVVEKKRKHSGLARRKMLRVSRKTKLSRSSWQIRLSEENVLVLDRPEVRVGEGKWSSMEVLEADHAARRALGVQCRGGQMVQPWARNKKEKTKKIELHLRYNFDVRDIPALPASLAIEKPELFEIELNGHKLDPDAECGWWCDLSLKKLPLPSGTLRKGQNVLSLKCLYDEDHPGLEIIYLLGAFGVSLPSNGACHIIPLPANLKLGDWCRQGLPFYSGAVSYTCSTKVSFEKAQRVFLKTCGWEGTAVRVSINGEEAGTTAWEPNEIDLTRHIKSGEPFFLEIELISHRRNSHGPLHNKEKWPKWTGPGQFENAGEKYKLVPCGLFSAPEIIVKSQFQKPS